jgi:hypothetical protein
MKRRELDGDHSSPSVTDITSEWGCTSLPSYSLTNCTEKSFGFDVSKLEDFCV